MVARRVSSRKYEWIAVYLGKLVVTSYVPVVVGGLWFQNKSTYQDTHEVMVSMVDTMGHS